MKKFTLLLTLLALAFIVPKANAEAVTGYLEKFDNLKVANHDFAPPGWGHIVDAYKAYYSDYYVDYQNYDAEGQDGSYLWIGSQTVGSSYDTYTVNDMLVTPAVTGNVSIYVKKFNPEGNIKFYTCTKTESGFKAGDEYVVTLPELSESAWTQVTLPNVPAGTYLGIRGDYVGIDEFTAESADLVLKKGLTIQTAKLTTQLYAGSYVDADESGNASFAFDVTLENTGEVALNPGDEGYSISIIRNDNNQVLSTLDVPVALAVGATSDPISISATMPVAEKQRLRFDVKENVSSTSKYGSYIELVPYKSDFFVSNKDQAEILAGGSTVDFGMTQTPIVKGFRLRNNSGGAPVTISSIVVPTGFSYSVLSSDGATPLTTPFTIAAHSEAALEVTMLSDAGGTKEGPLVISAEGYEPLSFNLKGTVVDPSKFYVNFEDGKFPDGSYQESTTWSISDFPNDIDLENNKYCAENSTVEINKLVFPKVRVAAGESLVFNASKRSDNSEVHVYYSADRKEWTEVKVITANASDDANKFSTEQVGSSWTQEYGYKQFTVDNIPAGDWYLAFGSGYARIDDIMGYTLLPVPEKELVDKTVSLPNSGTVNYKSTASITITSIGKSSFAEGELSAKLLLNSEEVATASVPALEKGKDSTLDFEFTPRAAGSFPVKIVVEGDGIKLEKEATMVIDQESSTGYHQVGVANSSSANAPVKLNYNNSDSETVYSKDVIGLPAGTAIQKIAYKGYNTGTAIQTKVSVWIENTSDGTITQIPEEFRSTESMTQVFSGNYNFEKKGGTKEMVDMLVIDMTDAPFIYTGENLRIIVRSEADNYKNVTFESQLNERITVYRANDYDLNSSKMSFAEMPVVNFLVDKELQFVTGKVTSAKDGSAIEGANVKLVSGNVEYSGTTAADGTYSIGVYQDKLTYTITATKEGYFKSEKELAMDGVGVVQDFTLDEATGFRISTVNVPTEAMVNSAYAATVVVENGVAKDAGSYTAELYVGGAVVATAEAVALEASKEYTFAFAYTPHQAGSFPAYVKFTSPQGTAQSEEVTIAVAEEKADSEVPVGVYAGKTNTASVFNFFYNGSITEIIYPKEKINVAAGSRILSIKFKGYKGDKNVDFAIKAWVENTQSSAFKGYVTDGMTLVYDQTDNMSGVKGGDGTNEVLFTFTLPEDFVYTGDNIRIVTQAFGSGWISVNFETDETATGFAKQVAKDNTSTPEELLAATTSWDNINMPVAYFELVPYKTVSGKVTHKSTGNAIEGASVTLKSGDVEYYGVSDAEGAYAVNVIQSSKDYEMTVAAEGYNTATQQVSFADGNVTADVALIKPDEDELTYAGTVLNMYYQTPVAGATVEVVISETQTLTATTGEDGAFSFEIPAAGTYEVNVSHPDYYAGYDEADLTNGSITDAEIYVAPIIYSVSGVVSDSENPATVITGATATLKKNGEVVATVTTDDYGMYSFGELEAVSGAEWTISLEKEGYQPANVAVDFSKANYGMLELNISMVNGYTYSGQVLNQYYQTPVAGATVEMAITETEVLTATTDAEGKFSIKAQAPGKYEVTVTCADYYAAYDEADLTNGNVTGAEIYIAPIVYSVSGVVSDSENPETLITGATATLKKNGETVATATTDDFGMYAFGELEAVSGADWTISLEKEGYDPATATVDFSKASYGMLELNISMTKISGVAGIYADGIAVYGGQNCIHVTAEKATVVNVYNAAGSLVRSEKVEAGKSVIEGLNSGVYIVNGVKVAVK